MLTIKNVKVYDIKETVIASRNAMRLEMPDYTEDEFEKGLKRATSLSKCGGGTGHSSFRKGIRVNFDMVYTQYITKQFQRYHWFDFISSSSLMHRITKMDFDKCCAKYVTRRNVDDMNRMVFEYNSISTNEDIQSMDFMLRDGTIIHADNKKDCLYYQFMMIIQNCPMGTELFVRITTNYEQLATIVKQRQHHKLREDWGEFIKFVQGLPYAKELIPEAFEYNVCL